MNDMHEAVTLPDPAVKRLLHSTELPEARSLYVRGWWFGRLCSPPIVVAIGAIVWLISGNLFASLVAPLSTFAIALVASRWLDARAWDFIPRKRQDPRGARSWQLLAAVLDAQALLITAIAFVLAMSDRPLSDGVIVFAIGAGGGVAVVQIIELALAVARNRDSAQIGARIIMIVAVVASSVTVAALAMGGRWTQESLVTVILGAATVLLAQSLWWVFTAVQRRHRRTPVVVS